MEEAALLPVLVRSAGGEAEARLRLPASATVADCKRRLANALLGQPKPEAQQVRAEALCGVCSGSVGPVMDVSSWTSQHAARRCACGCAPPWRDDVAERRCSRPSQLSFCGAALDDDEATLASLLVRPTARKHDAAR